MNPHMFQRIVWGLVLVTAGVFFLLDQTGLIEIDIGYIISTYWPVILMFYGFMGFIWQRKHHWGGSIWSLVLLGIGTMFLLKNLGVTHLSLSEMFQYLWPVALILVGLHFIFKPGMRNRTDWHARAEAEREAREERMAARRAARDMYKKQWQHAHDMKRQNRTPDNGNPHDARRDLSEEEIEVLKDIHGENAFHKHQETWEEKAPLTVRPLSHKTYTAHDHEKWTGYTDSGSVLHRHGFIGDVHLGQEPWELKPIQISHFIGDSVIDLTQASIPLGETPIQVSAFIGDVKILVPNDIEVEVRVNASSFIGDMKILDKRESGFMRSVQTQTTSYDEAERKLIVTTSMFIGDITIKKIG